MVVDLDQPEPSTRARPRRSPSLALGAWLAAAVAVVVTCMVVFWPDTGRSDRDLRQEGYVELASAPTATVWLLGYGQDAVSVTTNGRAGALCNSSRNPGPGYIYCQPGQVPGADGLALASVPENTETAEMVFDQVGISLPLTVVDGPADLTQAQGYDWAYAVLDEGADQVAGPGAVVADGENLP